MRARTRRTWARSTGTASRRAGTASRLRGGRRHYREPHRVRLPDRRPRRRQPDLVERRHGTVNLNGYHGAYLSATATVFLGEDAPGGEYGIFASNVHGPGLIEHTYASNMRDAAYYVGACPDCNRRLTDAHAENSALGYSGTNSGGHLIVERSEWDENTCGIVTNSQNNDDAPSPQDGACPDNGTGPTGSHSCTLFRKNYVHDNNNPNVPRSGTAALGPVGTGIVP